MNDPAKRGSRAGQAGTQQAPRTDPKLLELLVCPLTRTTLVYDPARQELLSKAAALAYPIRNGVPMMTPDAARALSDDEIARLS